MHILPKLDYEYNALEPYIDEQTMRIHHTKHHRAYLDKFNAAIKGTNLEEMEVEDILKDLSKVPENIRTAVKNNGGGFANHNMFWKVISPNGGEPSRKLLEAINKKFGSLDKFKEEFSNKALTHFGSGWAWLVLNKKELEIVSTANQDTPLSEGKIPVLCLDMWEHSFYLKWKNEKNKYVESWWHVINWRNVEEYYTKAIK